MQIKVIKKTRIIHKSLYSNKLQLITKNVIMSFVGVTSMTTAFSMTKMVIVFAMMIIMRAYGGGSLK